MYFHDRGEAGRLLSEQLLDYRFENTAVLALSPGGVLVGEAIARRLHSGLSLLLTSKLSVPGDSSLVLGMIDHVGNFSYNDLISPGQMEEYLQDFRGFLEEEKLHQMFNMTSIVGEHGLSKPEQLAGRTVIIATDGVKNGLSFEAAFHFLANIPVERVIAAIPVGPPEVIDYIRTRCDETHYLFMPDSFISVRHYYEENRPESSAEVMERINKVVSGWC